MLLLSRRAQEQIMIGDDICITICSINNYGHTVRVGIEAPEDIIILRKELYDKEQEKKSLQSNK